MKCVTLTFDVTLNPPPAEPCSAGISTTRCCSRCYWASPAFIHFLLAQGTCKKLGSNISVFFWTTELWKVCILNCAVRCSTGCLLSTRAPPVIPLRKGKPGIKVQLFFDKETTCVAWMEWYSPLKVWAGSRELGFGATPFFYSHTQCSCSPVTVQGDTLGCVRTFIIDWSSAAWLWAQLPSMTDHNTTRHWGTFTACPLLLQRSLTCEKGLIWSDFYSPMTLNFHLLDERLHQVRRCPRRTDSMWEY